MWVYLNSTICLVVFCLKIAEFSLHRYVMASFAIRNKMAAPCKHLEFKALFNFLQMHCSKSNPNSKYIEPVYVMYVYMKQPTICPKCVSLELNISEIHTVKSH